PRPSAARCAAWGRRALRWCADRLPWAPRSFAWRRLRRRWRARRSPPPWREVLASRVIFLGRILGLALRSRRRTPGRSIVFGGRLDETRFGGPFVVAATAFFLRGGAAGLGAVALVLGPGIAAQGPVGDAADVLGVVADVVGDAAQIGAVGGLGLAILGAD